MGDSTEVVPELQWPMSVGTYSAMINDAQIEGLYYGATLPIRRYSWMIDPNGAKPEVVQQIASDLNLPLMDEETGLPVDAPKGRAKKRFSHDRHLFHALRSLIYGFYYFEMVGVIEDGRFHLRKLAPRPASTIDQIQVAEDGGLVYIKQNINQMASITTKEIPVDRLVAYVWDQEGGNWVGRSMLRSIYRNWLIKDRLLRVDAIKHERNGVGTPIVEGAPGMGPADMAKLSELAQTFKAGESGGGAIPSGSKLTLQGVRGTLPDTIGSVKFHNEEMARRFLMMFMQLGQTATGSRALGGEFLDYFGLAQESIANWYVDITNEHVIEDLVDYNWPDESQVPLLTYHKADSDPAEALHDLFDKGALEGDDELKGAVKKATQMSRRGAIKTSVPKPNPPSVERKDGGRAVGVVASIPLPDRPLRRQPYAHEVTAQVNFQEMDQTWESNLEEVFARWTSGVTQAQIQMLAEDIANTSSLTQLSKLQAPVVGEEILLDAMVKMYESGVNAALAEASAQGKNIVPPVSDTHLESMKARASVIASVLANALSGMAGSRAVSLTGGSLTQAEVAQEVSNYLGGLSHQMVKDRLQGAMTTAQNSGRKAVMGAGQANRIYASEILDNNTCAPCTGVDGTEFKTIADAEYAYSTGGFNGCAGGDRCRGTLVAVYTEDNA